MFRFLYSLRSPRRCLFLALSIVVAGQCLLATGCAQAEPDRLRIATYNIRYLNSEIDSERLNDLRAVLEALDADVIGLQEIDDRAALEAIFDPELWILFIDDESGGNQDLALAVRRPLQIANAPRDHDADDSHFLFPAAADNHLFPNRRDVLVGEIVTPGGERFFVMVHHAKSRVGGRHTTEGRRVGASRAIVRKLRAEYADQPLVLLGDFNDNPDDKSVNILEEGDERAISGAENKPGAFMLNLTEPLAARGQVSIGLGPGDVRGRRIDATDPQSRERNMRLRGTDDHTGDILFDQILITRTLAPVYVPDSTRVFDGSVALGASDHLPVYAEFAYKPANEAASSQVKEPPLDSADAGLKIEALLPNPKGPDECHEVVILVNRSADAVDLAGWRLVDAGENVFTLEGRIKPGERLRIEMLSNTMPLNNNGDTIKIIDASGATRDEVSYAGDQAEDGNTIWFE